jgi:DNA polymerase I
VAEKPKKLILIDGMALAYRGHFAMIRDPRMTAKSVNTSAVYVFTNVLADLMLSHDPTHLAVVFDTPEPTHRHKAYREYKATRDAMPEDLQIALPYIDRLCAALNVPVLRYPGWEADDVVGALSRIAEQDGYETYMITPDKDYAQLVDTHTFFCKPSKGGSFDILGISEVCDEWGIERPDQVIDILGLMGDSSDNIPGVPGIGRKTAQKLIAAYGSVEGVYMHLDELKGKQRENLETNREQAFLSRELVTIDRHVPLTHTLDSLQREPWDPEAMAKLFDELEFKSIGDRLLGATYDAQVGSGTPARDLGSTPHEYVLVAGKEARSAFLADLSQQTEVCFDLETTGLDVKTCEIVGIAFSWSTGRGHFLQFPEGPEIASEILGELSPFFANREATKIGHNIKFDISVLRWHGVRVQGPFYDTMIAAYLAQPNLRRTMDALAEELLGYQTLHIEELIGEKGADQKSMREVPVETLTEYACEDADITLQLKCVFDGLISEFGQERVLREIECPLIPVLVEMEYAGIRVDTTELTDLAEQLVIDIDLTAKRIQELAGESFNLNSPKQLGEVLFDRLKLDPKAKRTKKTNQYITNEQVLTRLAPRHEIAEKILEYRMKTKLKSTYVDMLPGAIFEATGRVHTSYEQAVTATGRMQSHDPNLQNIPIRSDLGREIRRAFVAGGDDQILVAADYSQIELRIAAALSGEEAMKRAFEERFDIHTATAMRLFGTDQGSVTSDMRRHAKTVNFGILYGISAFGLSERSELSRTEAAELISNYFEQYPSLKTWQEETIAFAHDTGYVETVTGRRRYLRDIGSRNAAMRSAAERNAINAPIQGTAADMIKRAMVLIQDRLADEGLQTRMLLQVHDELVFEVPQSERARAKQIINDEMVGALPLGIPIEVEIGEGRSWLDAH